MRKRRRTPQQQATGIGSQGTGSINEKEINLYDAKARADQAKLNPKQAPVCHFHSCAISLAASGQSVKREAKVEQKKEGKKISLLFIFCFSYWCMITNKTNRRRTRRINLTKPIKGLESSRNKK